MKKKNLLVTAAVAGMLMGGQAAFAEEAAKKPEAKAAEGKNTCKGEGKAHCGGKDTCKSKDGKDTCKSHEEGKNSCGANGCGSAEKKEEKKP